jgi:hypothetical protein
VPTLTKPVLSRILDDEALTRGLGDAEARVLVEWTVDQAERLAEDAPTETMAQSRVMKLCRRCRAIGRFVTLWCQPGSQGSAAQLAAAERFNWPFPGPEADSYEILQEILVWEEENPTA